MTDRLDLDLDLALPAPDPAAWRAAHLDGTTDGRGGDDDLPALVRADDGVLAHGQRHLVEHGTPPPAAATYLAGWFAGGLAALVGRGLALAGAGFVVDPGEARWDVHPDGWPQRVRLGRPSTVLVVDGHPWSRRADVTVARTPDEVLDRTVAALVDLAEPIVEACRGLASVGRAGLWNEVGDGLGTTLADDERLEVTPRMVAVLAAAVRSPAARWRARPSLRFAPSSLGPVHVVQKGGCCLAYTRTTWPDVPDELLDAAERAYRARFPVRPGEPHHCSTCSLREASDCDARQVFWRELLHEHRAGTP